jgi:hypothetical protein
VKLTWKMQESGEQGVPPPVAPVPSQVTADGASEPTEARNDNSGLQTLASGLLPNTRASGQPSEPPTDTTAAGRTVSGPNNAPVEPFQHYIEPAVKFLHDYDFSVCKHDLYCPRGRHLCCVACHVTEFHPEKCVHLAEFSECLDFDC